MPKLPMKYRNSSPPWPAPKRGKARSHLKRPASSKGIPKKPAFKPVPYVRDPKVQKKFRKERHRYGVSVQGLATMQPRQLLHKLTEDGILPKWAGATCPHCATGRLGKLKYFKDRKHWAHRCSHKRCHKFTQPHNFHPIFFGGSGASFTSLGKQAAVLCCAVAGVPVTATPLILDMDDKAVFRIYEGLEKARAQHVSQKQKHIKYGGDDAWCDVEADEVDLAKNIVETSNIAAWEQWGGLVQRGRPDSLSLFRLKPKNTKKRAPGPGPISRRDWKPIADKVLKNRQVILHTDGARAYKMHFPGVAHYNVIHKKKKILQGGKYIWVKPHYTKVYKHKLPCGKSVQVKSGTQIIDRFWQHLRAYLKYASRKVASPVLIRKIRAAQWTYWHKNQDGWTALANMLRELRKM